jgi:hypothetical protein
MNLNDFLGLTGTNSLLEHTISQEYLLTILVYTLYLLLNGPRHDNKTDFSSGYETNYE